LYFGPKFTGVACGAAQLCTESYITESLSRNKIAYNQLRLRTKLQTNTGDQTKYLPSACQGKHRWVDRMLLRGVLAAAALMRWRWVAAGASCGGRERRKEHAISAQTMAPRREEN